MKHYTTALHLESIYSATYKEQGFLTATDAFGSGVNGFKPLADLNMTS